MKPTTFMVILALGVAGCDLGEGQANRVEVLSATLQLTNTSGRDAVTFHPAEDFDVTFTLTNTTGKRVTFYRGSSAPDVLFRVLEADSVVASSVDGYVFLMVTSIGSLEPGQSMRGYWRGPTTPHQYPRVVLSPGVYNLAVRFPKFDGALSKEVPAIPFSVVE
jgi:hypothetical protein